MKSILTNFKRIIIVSYRLPFHIENIDGQKILKQNSGGLVSAVSSLSEKLDTIGEVALHNKIIWIGCGEHSDSEYKQAGGMECRYQLFSVTIDEETKKLFYSGFSNDFLWPLFHYFHNYAVFNEQYYEAYVKAQKIFLGKILEIAEDDDLIWIHDYQLMMLPGMVREKKLDSTIGFFLHTPFPSFETFRMMNRSWREGLLKGILGADVVGFHINDYAQYFLRAVSRTLGYETGINNVIAEGRIIKVDAFPIGIDFKKFDEASRSKKVEKEVKQIKANLGNMRLLFSIDRLDYTKGFLHRLISYEYFLEKYPEWRERTVFNMIVIPSRDTIGSYQEMKKEIDALVGRINGKFGTIAWRPIIYQYRTVPFDELVALYNLCDVAIITPLRDGMNLVCKEFAACQTRSAGVLILSEMAGAAAELGEAILINPTDKTEVASAINKALQLSIKERILRLHLIRKRLMEYDVFSWAKDYINSIVSIKTEQEVRKVVVMDNEIRDTIVKSYWNSNKRIIFLDYDGTLVPFSKIPDLAVPSEKTLYLIKQLANDVKNQIVIISGRTTAFLDEYFSNLNVSLVAEHGAFIRLPFHNWQSEIDTNQNWKTGIIQVLNRYADHCVGSFIEEKTTSLAWHYRNLEAELAYVKVNQLREELRAVISNDTRLCMMEGSKVVEIRLSGYDKGFAALKFLKDIAFDFLLAIGDDKTDEDLFRVLSKNAITLKVGLFPSLAKYNLRNQSDVSALVSDLVKTNIKTDTERTFQDKPVNTIIS